MDQHAQISVNGQFSLELFINRYEHGHIIAENITTGQSKLFPLDVKLKLLLEYIDVPVENVTSVSAPMYDGQFNELNNIELWMNTPVNVHKLFQLDIAHT